MAIKAVTESSPDLLQWTEEPGRLLAKCGDVAIGAIFPPRIAAYRVRWRVWVTKNMNPVEGSAANNAKAKVEVAERFGEFLRLANLERRKS